MVRSQNAWNCERSNHRTDICHRKKKKFMINFKKEKDYTYISFDEKTQPMRK